MRVESLRLATGLVALPAHDLFEMARAQPRAEFVGRLIAGVRGDLSTAYDNPFSEAERAALLAHCLSSNPPREAP